MDSIKTITNRLKSWRKDKKIRREILLALRRRPEGLTAKELAEKLSCGEDEIVRDLNAGVECGLIVLEDDSVAQLRFMLKKKNKGICPKLK